MILAGCALAVFVVGLIGYLVNRKSRLNRCVSCNGWGMASVPDGRICLDCKGRGVVHNGALAR